MGCGGSKDNTVKHGTPTKDKSHTSPNKHHQSNAQGTTKHQQSPRKDPNHRANETTSSNNLNYYDTKPAHNSSPRHGGKGNQPYPQSKYATSNGSTQGEQFPEPHDKSYKKRIRAELVKATKGASLEDLEAAIAKFEKNRCEDGGDLTRANERLYYLKMKRSLRDSIRRSNVGVLEKTIKEARNCRYSHELQPQIEAAERKLAHLRELNQYSHDILAMDQATISEIHSYHRPPACVHDVMAASYMLLGHEESTLRDWSYLQGMAGKIGRDSLIHRVREFDSNDVDDKTAKRVKEILNYHELGDVRAASNGAATFHVWASNIVDKIEKDKQQEERNNRREEEDERRRHEELAEKNAASSTTPKAKRR